ncbi:MAG: hypothetical protein QM537_03545 [Candidatus Symbiobacter sp.]|nr:hypothetical protein [Candidatus Symbiobacter sp.]
MMLDSAPQRRYDSGVYAAKHRGRSDQAEIWQNPNRPHEKIGKCPNNMTEAQRQTLLNEAIEYLNHRASGKIILYVVHNGVIYAGRITNKEQNTFHGYPYCGNLPKNIYTKLKAMAERKDCSEGFIEWVQNHISISG